MGVGNVTAALGGHIHFEDATPPTVVATPPASPDASPQTCILISLVDVTVGIFYQEDSISIYTASIISDLIKNRIFILLSLGKAMEYLHTIGASGFVPTFIEHQFLLSKKTATFISGIIIIPASAIGYILGGFIASSLKLSSRGLMRLIMISSAVSFILFAVIMILNCDPIPFAGLNEDYDGTGLFFNLTAPCNSRCHCPTSFYSPICGRNGVSYFSSCFAGCMRSKITNKIKTYYNCSCINVGLVTVDKDNEFIDAIDGQCDSNCDKLHFSIAIFFSVIVFSGLSGIPGELLILSADILNHSVPRFASDFLDNFSPFFTRMLFDTTGKDSE
ncbi:solute carrier organic anion transporter family member 6A1-like [Sorex fumeus]|uniref:solute carrier organic anion transporter family member 6A1-like n=1 Tax=Sorex fumeus TaxID=62283 RepID=UPI0024ADFFF7|nr:solute carrier organic anion transporter family member 6A1-like [Sorex fumeus]